MGHLYCSVNKSQQMIADPLTLRAVPANTALVFTLTALGPGSKTIRTANTPESTSHLKETLTVSHDKLTNGRMRSLARFDLEYLNTVAIPEKATCYIVLDREPTKMVIYNFGAMGNIANWFNARMRSLFDGDTTEAFGTQTGVGVQFTNGEP